MIFKTKDDLEQVVKLNKPEPVIRAYWKDVQKGNAFFALIDQLNDKYAIEYPGQAYIEYSELDENNEPIIDSSYYEPDGVMLKDEYKNLSLRPTFELYKKNQINEFNLNFNVDMSLYLIFVKPILSNKVNKLLAKYMDKITSKYPQQEQLTWTQQVAEAKAYKADNTADTPLLDQIAPNDKNVFVDKILAKSASYTEIVGKAIKYRNEIDNDINNINSENDIDAINNNINKVSKYMNNLVTQIKQQ